MPLNDLSSAQATLNLRSNPNSIWPDSRSVTPRMGFYAPCSVRPGFSVSRDDLIFTSGSCFARNIERELLKHGFDLIRPEDHTLMKELINKYVSRSVLNELRWGLGLEPFPVESLIQVEDGLWHDPHLHPNQQPVSFEHAMSRRGDIDRMVALLPRARIVILTLGLVETWYDTRTGAWLNGIPPASARSADPDRFRFVRQSFGDVMQDLEDIHGILDQHGHPDFKIVLTVSPVAFKATQTGQDAVAANTYSKSVLRAAAEEFCARHANVDYFPSFEMVTLSDRSIAFCPDNIHVQEDMVARVMQFFVENYAPEVERGPSSAPRVSMSAFYLAARQALSDGDFMVAARLLQQIEATADVASLGMDPAEFYFHLGTATASCGVKNRLLNTYAVKCFKKSLRYRSEPSHARAIAQVLKGLGFKEHQDFSERASEASPA